MNQIDLLQSISKYFARFSEQVKILNGNNEFHINIHAENLIVKVLNIVYDLNLVNLNQSKNGNYSAIDLLNVSQVKKVSFQVTSTSSIDKVKDCIQKFFRNGVYKDASELNIYILTNKQRSYSRQSIQHKIEEEINLVKSQDPSFNKEAFNFTFEPEINIIDKTDLYKKLNSDNDLEKIFQLEKYIQKQYGIIEEKQELSEYYRGLKDMYYDTVMSDERGMTLDQIYTEPSFSILHSAFSRDDDRFRNKDKQKFYEADARYKIIEFFEDLEEGRNPLCLQKTNKLILILGYPGQGKSSFCKKFINDYILKSKTDLRQIFYFPLRSVRQVREFIYNPLSVLYSEACSFIEKPLDKSEFNKSLLILDGLDELYMRENLKLDEIDRLCIELVRLTEKFNNLQIIVTSRYGYVDDEKLTRENVLIMHLSSLTLNLQQDWLSKYSVYHPETWLTSSKLQALNVEGRYGHIKELLEQPLLLHMIASVSNEIDENTNRAKVYSQLFDELIERKYAKEGQIEILRNIQKEDLRDLIREVAFAIFESGNEYITKTELLKLPAAQTFLNLLPETNFRDSIKGIMISFYFKETEKTKEIGFDEDRSNYAIEFLHKSLREYMTAEKIFHSITTQFLDKRTNGKYIIDNPKSALLLINDIFGKQDLTGEIMYHLKEIINNSEGLPKEEVVDRMCLYLDDMALTDFLIEYRMDSQGQPVNIALRTFYGFWYFISCLGLEKNYLKSNSTKENVAHLFKHLRRSDKYDVAGFDFSYQDLSNLYFDRLSFYDCRFINTDFTNTDFHGCRFIKSEIKQVSFKDSYIDDVWFSGCEIIASKVGGAYLGNLQLRSCVLKNINFGSAEVRWLDVSEYESAEVSQKYKTVISECEFNQSSIDAYSLEQIKLWYPEVESQNFVMLKDKDDSERSLEDPNNETSVVDPEDYKRIIFSDSFGN
ncbi:SMEK domain-containing protein [Paraflavitalea sp. CAU 1676]|uniref:SMEK domain-containing protein n=1 Tax=Paraflavitalea sp. CAU 1676 TaxID=3032598 RepID=UPI0023DA0526|nr:SMEK domain-containing protein [Paraflavitalea sp. CAU 1676]MDF2189338.1 SMEK domain-containing protein [Paraflavitalea sp. CAU 1676]